MIQPNTISSQFLEPLEIKNNFYDKKNISKWIQSRETWRKAYRPNYFRINSAEEEEEEYEEEEEDEYQEEEEEDFYNNKKKDFSRIKYSPSFLLSLQFSFASLAKPTSLPNLPQVILLKSPYSTPCESSCGSSLASSSVPSSPSSDVPHFLQNEKKRNKRKNKNKQKHPLYVNLIRQQQQIQLQKLQNNSFHNIFNKKIFLNKNEKQNPFSNYENNINNNSNFFSLTKNTTNTTNNNTNININSYNNNNKTNIINNTKVKKIIKLDLNNNNICLRTTNNAWKPKRKETDPNQIILSDLRSLLNKLSEEKMGKVEEGVRRLEVHSQLLMRQVVNLIFEKAISEASYSTLYAKLAKTLSTWSVTNENEEKKVTFRELIITRCQNEFEKHKYDDNNESNKKNNNNKTEMETMEEEEIVRKKKILGNIKFIGELYKQDMIGESIVHSCIVDLLRLWRDEGKLESVCKLLSTVGSKVDHPHSKCLMDLYIKRLKELSIRKNITSRDKFIIQDIIELRENCWLPRNLSK